MRPILVLAVNAASLLPLVFNLFPKYQKTFTNSSWSKKKFFYLTHCSQTNPFVRVGITSLHFRVSSMHSFTTFCAHHRIFHYLPIALESTLLWNTLPFEPLTITSVFLRLTFNPLLSNTSFDFKNFSFKSSLLSSLKPSHLHTKFH